MGPFLKFLGKNHYIPSKGTITYPTKREIRKIIDSKVPAGMGYVRFARRVNLFETTSWFYSGYLVGGFNPSENISQNGNLPQFLG